MTDAPVLYHCPQTRGATAYWMNIELGGPCIVEIVDIKKNAQKSPAHLAINPMGKIPALAHRGETTTETAAICAYLADAFAEKGLAPTLDDPKRGAYYRWMFFAPSCIEPAMLDTFSGVTRENPASVGHGLVPDVLKAIDLALERGPYLLGEQFTAADVVFGSTLNFAVMFGAFDEKPSYKTYLDRLKSRDGFQKAMADNLKFIDDLGWEK
ncbi:MAG: glutathione S-transferase family protein [Pseudomonadota bacterium]